MSTDQANHAFQKFLIPISDTEPCGPNLEYDQEYANILARMIPKGDAQYGDFVRVPDAPNWVEIERDCCRMLLRTRDIAIILLLMRCHIHLDHANGLREVFALLLDLLERYPEQIHPQLVIDGEHDPSVRANALAALVDPEGILGDLRDIYISKNSAMHLQIRDVERAFATPRPPDALSPESVQLQLADLYRAGDFNLLALQEVAEWVTRLEQWLRAYMPENAPDLGKFFHLLRHFQGSANGKINAPAVAHSSPVAAAPQLETAFAQTETYEQTKERALQSIRQARDWFERYEPSSPVPILLRQAERMVNKRLHEIIQAIPADLVEHWSVD
jgi:type VI secretion system protein ImpA